MKIIIDSGENEQEYGQNANGIWRCKNIKIKCKDHFDSVQLANAVIIAINEMLKEVNKE